MTHNASSADCQQQHPSPCSRQHTLHIVMFLRGCRSVVIYGPSLDPISIWRCCISFLLGGVCFGKWKVKSIKKAAEGSAECSKFDVNRDKFLHGLQTQTWVINSDMSRKKQKWQRLHPKAAISSQGRQAGRQVWRRLARGPMSKQPRHPRHLGIDSDSTAGRQGERRDRNGMGYGRLWTMLLVPGDHHWATLLHDNYFCSPRSKKKGLQLMFSRDSL